MFKCLAARFGPSRSGRAGGESLRQQFFLFMALFVIEAGLLGVGLAAFAHDQKRHRQVTCFLDQLVGTASNAPQVRPLRNRFLAEDKPLRQCSQATTGAGQVLFPVNPQARQSQAIPERWA